MSMAAVDRDVGRDRERFQQRQAEIAEADALDEQTRLVAEGRPVALWPAHLPMRQQYDHVVRQQQQQAAAAVRADSDVAAEAFAERMEQLAERSRRRWWWHR